MNTLKKLKLITISLLIFAYNLANGQSLDEILEKYYKAVGMEYLKNVQTIQYKGNYYNRFLEKMGGNLPEKLLKPDFTLWVEKRIGYRYHVISDPGEFTIGYFKGDYWIDQNGNVDENWNPGKPDRRIIQQAINLEGFLYNWKSKGYKATKLENTELNGREHYTIQLINTEKDSIYFYINTKTNLISYTSYGGDLADGKEHPGIEFQKYKIVENIEIPFKRIQTELMLNGSYGKKDILIKEVKLNPKFEPDIFKSTYKN